MSVGIMQELKPEKVLIVYPRVDIKEGWNDTFRKLGWTEEVSFTTYKSAGKFLKQEWDLVILDEIHEASTAQLTTVNKLNCKNILGLTGTLTKSSEYKIESLTGVKMCYRYTIKQAVEEGVLCDYKIYIHKVKLDGNLRNGKKNTERGTFNGLEYVKQKLIKEEKETFFIELKQIAVIQNSISKKEYTKKLIKEFEKERVIVFCGVTYIADELGIPSYHSGNNNTEIFKKFCLGDASVPHLSTVKMMQAGITIKPINKAIFNYLSGNPEDGAQKICRVLALEMFHKEAEIHIVTSDEKLELDRLETALMFFDKDKITYI